MNTLELTLENVTDILNWYALEGSVNWGTWGNYPNLPVSASYHSFDTCHLRIKLEKMVSFKGHVFNCIADGRRVPGSNLKTISIYALLCAAKEEGVQFNGYMTLEKEAERKREYFEKAAQVVRDFEAASKYEVQEKAVREQLQNAFDHVSVHRVKGQSLPNTITDFALEIRNYCENETATIIVDLVLTGRNARNTAGRYKVVSVKSDVEEVVRRFTNERLESYLSNLERHRNTLAELTNA